MNKLIGYLLICVFFGGTYVLLLVKAYFVIKGSHHFVAGYSEFAALLIPMVVYLILTFLIRDRQGLNWIFANLVIAVPAIVSLNLGTYNSTLFWGGFAITMITAFAAWIFIPDQGLTRLF
jgi:hypothetical protein